MNLGYMEGEGGITSKARHNGHDQSDTRHRVLRVWPRGTKMTKIDVATTKVQEAAITPRPRPQRQWLRHI